MKKILMTTIALGFFACFAFVSFEPTIGEAAESQATTTVTLIVASEISLTGCSNISMSPNIDLTQDSSIGTTTCSVATSDVSGYTLSMKATSSPALARVGGGDSFDDYATTSMPTAWSEVGATEKLFGFTVYGDHVSDSVWGTGDTCGTAGIDAVSNTGQNYYGFYTVATTTASSNNTTVGTDTVLCVAAEQGDSVSAQSGTYQAIIEVTATTQ